uniref:PB1 domain-containing protein n=1 Tax=Nelumbo nucifera TaxID=4432 RepID=A0A822YH83_NELNU|nr:TPA_asm: hypothetical protein HUJ06_009662 [Nelumbo nucifera]
MVGASLESNDVAVKAANVNHNHDTVKYLCSYGGKILPRFPDGKLRYVGGETRVLAVDRSTPFSVSLRCQLPNEDLDALVSVTSDEDLANLIEEYDRASTNRDRGASSRPHLKIRAFLSPPKSIKQISPPPSASSSTTSSFEARAASKSLNSVAGSYSPTPTMVIDRCVHHICNTPLGFPVYLEKPVGKHHYYCYHAQGNHGGIYLVHNGNHWQ